MSAGDPLAQALQSLEDPRFAESLSKLARILANLEESGLLDVLEAVTRPEVVEKLWPALLGPGVLRLLDRLDRVADVAAALGEAVEEAKPVGVSGLLAALRDPDVARGLGVLVAFLKKLGATAGSREA